MRINDLLTGLGHFIGGAVLVLAAIGFLVPTIEESLWAFTTVDLKHACGDGQSGGCVHPVPGRVVATDGRRFHVSYNDAHDVQQVTLQRTPAPPVGSRVVLETWKDRVVSVVDTRGHRVRAEEWPAFWHDLGEGMLGVAGVLLCGAFFAWMVVRLDRVRPRPTSVTE